MVLAMLLLLLLLLLVGLGELGLTMLRYDFLRVVESPLTAIVEDSGLLLDDDDDDDEDEDDPLAIDVILRFRLLERGSFSITILIDSLSHSSCLLIIPIGVSTPYTHTHTHHTLLLSSYNTTHNTLSYLLHYTQSPRFYSSNTQVGGG